jgi:enterochelin esterase-like enzyme
MPKATKNKVNCDINALDVPSDERVSSAPGEFVTEILDFDGGRKATVYVPTRPPEAILFATDGQRIARWGPSLEKATLPPTMVVGVHSLNEETLRLHEYSLGFDSTRFAAHETFFVEDVRRWTASRFGVALPRERTAVFGVSAGAELALALGLSHSQIYGSIFSASPGAGYRPPAMMPSAIPRTYLVAGTEEPFFLDNAMKWAKALRDRGADVVMKKRSGTHGGPFWEEELPLMVEWAFGDSNEKPTTY